MAKDSVGSANTLNSACVNELPLNYIIFPSYFFKMFSCLRVTRIGDIIKNEASRQKLNGAAACLIDFAQGGNNHVKCIGTAEMEHGARINTRTVFDIGELGQQFTAMAILLHVEDGTSF